MFFESENGRSYALSKVVSFMRDHKDNVVLVKIEGVQVEVNMYAWDRALARSIQCLIPAREGHFVIRAPFAEGDADYDKEPIVGWASTAAGDFLPVTAEGVDEDGGAILLPDGGVVEASSASYRTLEAYINAKEEELGRIAL